MTHTSWPRAQETASGSSKWNYWSVWCSVSVGASGVIGVINFRHAEEKQDES